MSEEKLAIDTLERLLVQMQGMEHAVKILRDVGSAKGMLTSLKTQTEAAQKDLDEAKKALKTAQEAEKRAKTDAEALLRDAESKATKLTHEANEKAHKLVQDAKETSAIEVANEKRNREGTLKNVTAQIAAAQQKLKDLEDANAKATETALAIERRAAAAQASLEKVQASARALSGA